MKIVIMTLKTHFYTHTVYSQDGIYINIYIQEVVSWDGKWRSIHSPIESDTDRSF